MIEGASNSHDSERQRDAYRKLAALMAQLFDVVEIGLRADRAILHRLERGERPSRETLRTWRAQLESTATVLKARSTLDELRRSLR